MGPVPPLPASRALTRVTPVAPQRVTRNPDSPLGRSGLDVRELFEAPDQIVVRSKTPAVALELGLEHARGAMVRNQPADALAALDQVWSGAKHTEAGWYVRGGSLALLGLPGEASRIVTAGLLVLPQSAANFFLQSLVQLTLGNLAAAQLSLENAAAHSAPDALVFIQRALLSAQNGDVAHAQEVLKRAAATWPDHPALAYGRDMMREILRKRVRDVNRAAHSVRTPLSVDVVDADAAAKVSSESSRADSLSGPPTETAGGPPRDVASESLHALGILLASGTGSQALAEARMLLGSLSAGGILAGAMTASRAHATRAALAALIDALGGETPAHRGLGWDAESVDGHWQRSTPEWSPKVTMNEVPVTSDESLAATVRVLITALRDGRPEDFEQQLRSMAGSSANTTVQLLRAIAGLDVPPEHASPGSQAGTEQRAAYISNDTPEHVLLSPLRLGLALLPDSESHGDRMHVAAESDAAVRYTASMGAASTPQNDADMRSVTGSFGSLVAALGLLAAAVLAFSASLPLVAIACTGAGIWLALRRGTRAP